MSLPVVDQLAGREGKNVAGQRGDLNPGEDEETALVDNQWDVGAAGLITPADPSIARRHPPSGASEEQAGEDATLATANKVAQLGADRDAVAEIVIAVEVLLKEPALSFIIDQLQ